MTVGSEPLEVDHITHVTMSLSGHPHMAAFWTLAGDRQSHLANWTHCAAPGQLSTPHPYTKLL